MVMDRQVRRLLAELAAGRTLTQAAARSDMDEKTARRYRDLGAVPSDVAASHTWRTRTAPFPDVWTEVHEQLTASPELQPKALFK